MLNFLSLRLCWGGAVMNHTKCEHIIDRTRTLSSLHDLWFGTSSLSEGFCPLKLISRRCWMLDFKLKFIVGKVEAESWLRWWEFEYFHSHCHCPIDLHHAAPNTEKCWKSLQKKLCSRLEFLSCKIHNFLSICSDLCVCFFAAMLNSEPWELLQLCFFWMSTIDSITIGEIGNLRLFWLLFSFRKFAYNFTILHWRFLCSFSTLNSRALQHRTINFKRSLKTESTWNDFLSQSFNFPCSRVSSLCTSRSRCAVSQHAGWCRELCEEENQHQNKESKELAPLEKEPASLYECVSVKRANSTTRGNETISSDRKILLSINNKRTWST